MESTANRRFVYLLIGVMYMFNCYGCSSGLRYKNYSSKDPQINISLDYISGWLYSEDRGGYGSYAQVIFYEPEKKDKSFKASMVVTIKDSAKVEFGLSTIESAAEDLVGKRLKFEDAKVLTKSKSKLLKTDAVSIELSYKTIDKLYSIDAKLIPVRERIAIFKKDDKFYTLRYENTAEDFAKFNKAFSHCIKTLKFKDNR